MTAWNGTEKQNKKRSLSIAALNISMCCSCRSLYLLAHSWYIGKVFTIHTHTHKHAFQLNLNNGRFLAQLHCIGPLIKIIRHKNWSQQFTPHCSQLSLSLFLSPIIAFMHRSGVSEREREWKKIFPSAACDYNNNSNVLLNESIFLFFLLFFFFLARQPQRKW